MPTQHSWHYSRVNINFRAICKHIDMSIQTTRNAYDTYHVAIYAYRIFPITLRCEFEQR